MNRAFHATPLDQLLTQLRADVVHGLSPGEAARRLAKDGPNRIETEKPPGPWAILLRQVKDLMMAVLGLAAAVSWALGEGADAAAIVAIMVLNTVLGFVQEVRAERSLEALKELAAPQARVVRQGRVLWVPSAELVPGDRVQVEAGDRVPADLRLLEAWGLEVDESLLTGESVPVEKRAAWIGRGDEDVAERVNMLFMGTMITRGRAEAVVVATGPRTEMGEIAALIGRAGPESTPLQRRMQELGRVLVGVSVGLVSLVYLVGLARGLPAYGMFLTGVSLAVAVIPEGLPAAVTVALALGVQRMIRRSCIVRRLPAVETLGSITAICADKTGTLTRNEMTVIRVELAHTSLAVTGSGYGATGELLERGRPAELRATAGLERLLQAAVLCNRARLPAPMPGPPPRAPGRQRRAVRPAASEVWGDPTEIALLVLGRKTGRPREAWADRVEQQAEFPFDADRKRMSVVVAVDGREWVVLCKGAPEAVVARCSRVEQRGGPVLLGEPGRRRWLERAEALSAEALRVLALAYRPLRPGEVPDQEGAESELILLGLVGMHDPPREGVERDLERARRAGIRTLMITGDHPRTAEAIARALGIAGPGEAAVTGRTLDRMDERELARVVGERSVFARVSPRHKVQLVRALKARGEPVAMTGDGVNDAAAVKEADVGIAMGRCGAEVTREAASVVLTDDRFGTILAAVEEGRGLFQNVRTFMRYLLGCNAGEVLTMLAATLLALPLPLTPLQILWMNLVTDGLPAVALGMDPPAPGVMDRPLRRAGDGVLAGGLGWQLLRRGAAIGASALGVFVWMLARGADLATARTAAFTSLVAAQLFYVFSARSEVQDPLERPLRSNPWLLGAVWLSWLAQTAALHVPILRSVLGTVPLPADAWAGVLLAASWPTLWDVARHVGRAAGSGVRRARGIGVAALRKT
ncbi:cation-translocating P-type ATPase [Limnochorda pilosa]|uniref:ATPase n=1 Tax=Limnochorda pilosa TaxID=1555112 RepID=A0A0K2SK04_LIMPI|nr:cation-transporting P-type ATPase [Limnochorda pilosa]BAS27430.1 ATPase [Limnochorda pilosa]